MKDELYDRALAWLALAGPLLMLVLGSWRASLDRWYAPLDSGANGYFGERFEHDISDWLAAGRETSAELVVIADRQCPCTRATLIKLDEAVAQSGRKDVRVVVRDIRDARADRDAAWARVLKGVPATPTLLAVQNGRLVYAGPVTSGSFCTTALGRVLGVAVLQSPHARALFDVVNKGCYCRLAG